MNMGNTKMLLLPYQVNKNKDFKIDTIYFNNKELEGLIESENKRPLVKIEYKGNSIIRKIRGHHKLKKEQALLDYTSVREIGYPDINERVTISKANFFDKYLSYFLKHPKEELRLSYYLFLLSTMLAFISITLAVISISLTLKTL